MYRFMRPTLSERIAAARFRAENQDAKKLAHIKHRYALRILAQSASPPLNNTNSLPPQPSDITYPDNPSGRVDQDGDGNG